MAYAKTEVVQVNGGQQLNIQVMQPKIDHAFIVSRSLGKPPWVLSAARQALQALRVILALLFSCLLELTC